MLRNLRNTRRLFSIARILAREDALFILDDLEVAPALCAFFRIFSTRKPNKRKGERLAAAFEKLGPTFIKLGQALSTRSDLIGDELAGDLAKLRDNLPPFPSYIARKIVEEEFDRQLRSYFQNLLKRRLLPPVILWMEHIRHQNAYRQRIYNPDS